VTAVPLAAGVLAALVSGGVALAAGWGLLGSALLALGVALAVGAVTQRWAPRRPGAASRQDEITLAGRDGTVVTAVPGPPPGSAGAAATAAAAPAASTGPVARGSGEVTLVVEGHVVRMDAYADAPLAVGAPVRVVRVLSPTSVLVEPR
jgi:hypothetical protein